MNNFQYICSFYTWNCSFYVTNCFFSNQTCSFLTERTYFCSFRTFFCSFLIKRTIFCSFFENCSFLNTTCSFVVTFCSCFAKFKIWLVHCRETKCSKQVFVAIKSIPKMFGLGNHVSKMNLSQQISSKLSLSQRLSVLQIICRDNVVSPEKYAVCPSDVSMYWRLKAYTRGARAHPWISAHQVRSKH